MGASSSVQILFFCTSVCLICQQDCTKCTEWISTKLGPRMGLVPDQTPVSFGVHRDKGTDSGLFL